MTNTKTLFNAFEMGNLTLKNRIVMAPMTRNFSPNDNVPGDNVVDYYRRRAEG
ncbi:MAG: 12-oxophytodienoate reductase, partial [Porticoccaceae bacterium]